MEKSTGDVIVANRQQGHLEHDVSLCSRLTPTHVLLETEQHKKQFVQPTNSNTHALGKRAMQETVTLCSRLTNTHALGNRATQETCTTQQGY